ncbi:MAG: threonine ammonia-lyase [Polyangiales bacterium]
MITLSDIEQARARVGAGIYVTPCARSQALSERLGCELYLKLENLQMTGSFKERGAFNKLALLGEEQRAAGVIAASAGNHAQGLAFAAKHFGVRATIVMPVGTALIKRSATLAHGAEVILHGETYDDSVAEAARLAAERKLTPVPAFDDDAVIAGQGTIGLELLEQVPNLDVVVVPVGGGGLAGGIAVAIKSQRPEVTIYGVQAELVPSMHEALRCGAPVLVEPARTLADGVAVRRVSARTLELATRYLDRVALVGEEEIAQAVLLLLELEKTVAEGAGAAALAAALQGELGLEGKRVVVVVSGGNIDVNLLSRIIDRGLVKSGRCMRLWVLIPDMPGSLAALLATTARLQANVLQVHHDRLAARTEPGMTAVELVLETRGFDHIDEIEAAITDAGWVISA